MSAVLLTRCSTPPGTFPPKPRRREGSDSFLTPPCLSGVGFPGKSERRLGASLFRPECMVGVQRLVGDTPARRFGSSGASVADMIESFEHIR